MWDKFSKEDVWISGILAGAIIRAMYGKHSEWWVTIREAIVGVFLAYLCTDWIMAIGDLPYDTKIGVAGLVTLLGGRLVTIALERLDPIELLRVWRGK